MYGNSQVVKYNLIFLHTSCIDLIIIFIVVCTQTLRSWGKIGLNPLQRKTPLRCREVLYLFQTYILIHSLILLLLLFQALGALVNSFIYCLPSQSQSLFGKLQALS